MCSSWKAYFQGLYQSFYCQVAEQFVLKCLIFCALTLLLLTWNKNVHEIHWLKGLMKKTWRAFFASGQWLGYSLFLGLNVLYITLKKLTKIPILASACH